MPRVPRGEKERGGGVPEPEVLKIRAKRPRARMPIEGPGNRGSRVASTYLFLGTVDTHFSDYRFVQANCHRHDEVLGLYNVHPPDERHLGHEPPAVEHQSRPLLSNPPLFDGQHGLAGPPRDGYKES